MIDPVTGWFKITQYDEKDPTEITYDQGSELIGHECKQSLIEK